MDARVQSLLHHQWPSPAAIRARLPQTSAPGFPAGHMSTHQYSLHAVLTSEAFTSELSPLRSPQSEVGYNYTANRTLAVVGLSPTGRVLLWAAQAACCQAPFFGYWLFNSISPFCG
jgi:hypothetical protein